MIIANLTTLPNRQESLKETISSLLPQVDKINVYLHGYNELPKFLQHKKINVTFDVEFGDHGDIDKTFWVDKTKGSHYMLLCDDDLIYPSDYAESIVKSINQYKKKAIVSYHGSILKTLPIARYYSDRYVYPCLGNVERDQEMSIIGTGTLGYHTSLKLERINLKEKPINMLDIHLSIWAKENKVPLYVLAHKEGWIKHSEKVDLDQTIYAQSVNNDWLHTSLIMEKPHLFGSPKPMIEGMPVISIVVVNSRGRKQPEWLQQCYDSIRGQSYYNIQPVIVENYDRMITIGKAFNEGVKASKGDWILFLGDDDYITVDYVQALVSYAYFSGDTKCISVSTFLTMFTQLGENIEREPRELAVTGMWKREYLEKYPFCEFLTKQVDTEAMMSAEARGDRIAVMKWHYGYFYRSHLDQVSGHKQLVMKDRYASWRTDEAKNKLAKFRNVPVTLEVKNG